MYVSLTGFSSTHPHPPTNPHPCTHTRTHTTTTTTTTTTRSLSCVCAPFSPPQQVVPPAAEELHLEHVLKQHVVIRGPLFKRATSEHISGSPWRERFYVVSDGRLFWFKTEQSEIASGCVSLVDCRVAAIGVMDRANCFQVDSPQMRLYLSAAESRERFKWVNAIRTEIARLIHVASVRAKRELTEAKTAARNRSTRGSNNHLVDVLNLSGNDVRFSALYCVVRASFLCCVVLSERVSRVARECVVLCVISCVV
jgi:PH domain